MASLKVSNVQISYSLDSDENVKRQSGVSEIIRHVVLNGWAGYTKTSSAVRRRFDSWDSKLVSVDRSETVSR